MVSEDVMSRLGESVRRARDTMTPIVRDFLGLSAIEAGVPYVRRKTWDVIETAWVSGVIEDDTGVSHIRFDVTLRHHDRCFEDGPRTMGLDSFVRLYHRQN